MPELISPYLMTLTIFVLACFVGYYVVWKVTPALHTPLIAVTNAISSIIILGALLAAGTYHDPRVGFFSAVAIFITAINLFGGFIITHRMLNMYKK